MNCLCFLMCVMWLCDGVCRWLVWVVCVLVGCVVCGLVVCVFVFDEWW